MNMAVNPDSCCNDIVITCENIGFAIGSGSFITYEQFDAVGDGVADDTIPIQQAVTASAAGGGPIMAAAKTYKVTGTIFLASNAEIINAAGTVYDMRDCPAGTVLFAGRGVAAAAVPVTDIVDGGDTTLPVASGAEAGFTSGDMVKLWSDDIFDPARTDTRKGELNHVSSTTPGQVRLVTGSIDTYVTSPRLQKITPIQNVRIVGGTIHGSFDPAGDLYAIELQYAEDCTIERVRCEGVPSHNIRFIDALNCGISKCNVYAAVNPTTGTAFAFALACRACYLEDSYARNMVSGFKVTSSSVEGGVVRDSRVVGNTFEDAQSDAILVNANCDDVLVDGNVINFPAGIGISSECRRLKVTDNKVRRPAGMGISLRAGTQGECTAFISENRVSDSGSIGIDVSVATGTPTPPGFLSAIVIDNRVERPGLDTAIRFSDQTGVGRNVEIAGNTCLNGGITLQGVRDFVVANNILNGIIVNGSGIRLLTCLLGSIIGNVIRYVNSATGPAINLQTAVSRTVISGNVVECDGPAGLTGVTVNATCSGIIIGINEFEQVTAPVVPSSFVIAAGVLSPTWCGPYAIRMTNEGGAAADDLTSIVGIPLGMIQYFASGVNGQDPTFKHGVGNLFLGADFTLQTTRDRIGFQSAPNGEMHCVSKMTN